MLYGIERMAGTLNFIDAGPILIVLLITASPNSILGCRVFEDSSILSSTSVSSVNASFGTSSVMPVTYNSMVAPSFDINFTSDLVSKSSMSFVDEKGCYAINKSFLITNHKECKVPIWCLRLSSICKVI